jgi:hypothetical protein
LDDTAVGMSLASPPIDRHGLCRTIFALRWPQDNPMDNPMWPDCHCGRTSPVSPSERY